MCSTAVAFCAPKLTKTNRIISVRFFISWFATGLVTMQCIVCTLRVPLRAVQLAQRFASKLARLCYYARFAHYKSCCPHQKKTIRKGCLFSCDSGLETKLRFVSKRHCVCLPLHAVQLAQRFASKLARLCYYARYTRYKSCCPHHQKALKTQCFQGFCFLFSVVTRRSGDSPPKYSGSLPKC